MLIEDIPRRRPPAAYLGGFSFLRSRTMRSVEVRQNGVALGTVQFRGVSSVPSGDPKERRLYKCTPTACVPKEIARNIADRLMAGVTDGSEKDYEWRS
jgi:hypothetical protein